MSTDLHKDTEKIIKQDIDLPPCVEEKINLAYEQIGGKKPQRMWGKYPMAAGIAAVFCILVGATTIGIAANYFLNVKVKEEPESAQVELKVDNTKIAHKVEISADYVPEGYTSLEVDPSRIVYSHENDGPDLSITAHNAADLDAQGGVWNIRNKQSIENTTINGMDALVIKSDSFYEGLGESSVFLIDKDNGYAVQIHHDGKLSVDELKKIAQGVKVKVLEETIEYRAEEDSNQTAPQEAAHIFTEENFRPMNTEISFPMRDENDSDVRYTVKSVKVQDSISLSQFPKTHFSDFDGAVAPYLNEDGTLKPRNIAETDINGDIVRKDTVNSKFVVVEMRAKHVKGAVDNDVSIALGLTNLKPTGNGNYTYPETSRFATDKKYELQYDGIPIYFDKATNNRTHLERITHYYFATIQPGESLDYTLIYVVDEDQLDNMVLSFPTRGDTFVKLNPEMQ